MIDGIRFRSEEGKVLLQCRETSPQTGYRFHGDPLEVSEWRDAKVEDLIEVASFVIGQSRLSAVEKSIEWMGQEMARTRNEQ